MVSAVFFYLHLHTYIHTGPPTCVFLTLKGVFTKNERGYRLNAIKKRF